jgi:S-adenosylmethionine/arginine decarboxylase-like enzyme
VEAVTVCPADSRMAHFKVTTCGSSSTQRILAILGTSLTLTRLSVQARLRRIIAAAQSSLKLALFSGSDDTEVK